MLPIPNLERRINSILRVSNSFFFFRFTIVLFSSFLLLLSYPTYSRESEIFGRRSCPPSFNSTLAREIFETEELQSPFFLSSVSSALHEADAFPSVFSLSLSLRGNFVMHFIYSQRQILIYRGGTGKCPRERGTQGPRPFPFSSFLRLLPPPPPPPPRPTRCVQLSREGPPSWSGGRRRHSVISFRRHFTLGRAAESRRLRSW